MLQQPYEQLDNWKYVALRILVFVLLGVALAAGVVFLLYVRCETPERLCRAASDHPAWALISGVAAAPALTLLWHWRTTSRGREAVQRDQEIFSARFADGVRMLELGGLSAYAGLNALRRIASDSPDIYTQLVLSTLGAFIRQKSPGLTTHEYYAQEPDPLDQRQISQLVQSAVSVVGSIPVPPGFAVDLQDVNLTGADMTNFQLNGARLDESLLDDLQAPGISLVGASLVKTSLLQADLRGAALDRADLRGARLKTARLEDATFSGARYNDTGGFPDGFEPAAMGMVLDES